MNQVVDEHQKGKNLPTEIIDFYDAIVEKVEAWCQDTQQSIESVKEEQNQLASKLQQSLAQGESLRKADFKRLIGEVMEKRKAREKEVMEMLVQFQQEEQALAQELKRVFGDGRQVRLRDFKRFLAEARKTTKSRREEIEEITKASQAIRKNAEETIARFHEERVEIAKEWEALVETMQKKRMKAEKDEQE